MRGRFLAAPGALLIALAAALWGTDALLRRPLAQSTEPATIVFGEHLVLVLLTLPLIPPALVAVTRAGARYVAAAAAIGIGASALATILFTEAFVQGDPVTPVVLQKIQPLVVVVAAWFILGERPRAHFGWFLLAGLVGTWLIAFPSPFEIHVEAALPALYAIAAAVLWAFGTVLGRLLATRLRFQHVTALRFAFGLPASALAVLVLGAPFRTSASDAVWIAALAVVTGLVALSLYYYGLQRTPAVIAALAELTFPVTAAAVGYFAFDATLDGSQWVGVALTSALVLLLPMTGPRVVRLRREKLVPATAWRR
jgi:drug/metabolite transporter (DMT)-like permease